MKGEEELSSGKKGLKIAIFGGGAVGSILIEMLQKLDTISLIFCMDNNAKRAKCFIKTWTKVILIETDDNSYEKLIHALQGCFIVVNAASSEINDFVMQVALEIEAHYFDFASLRNDVSEQKNWHKSFVKKGIAGWINMGVGPGLTNLIAAKLIEELTDCIVRVWTAEHTDSEELEVLWKRELLVDEMTSKIPCNGFSYEPFSCPESYTFPAPIGKQTCVNMNQNERLTLLQNPDVRELYGKSGGSDIEKLRTLYPRATKSQKKKRLRKFINTLPQTPTPKQIDDKLKKGTLRNGWIAIAIEVDGLNVDTDGRESRKATWIGLSLREVPRGTTHINFNTSIVAFCAILEMINAEKLEPGVWAPDQLPKETREKILSCVEQKTHPIKYKI